MGTQWTLCYYMLLTDGDPDRSGTFNTVLVCTMFSFVCCTQFLYAL